MIIILEAKRSAPNPESEEKLERFSEYIDEIVDKLCDTIDLYVNQALKKKVPAGFKDIDYNRVTITFVLVIKTHERNWLPPVKDALEQAVFRQVRVHKLWKCNVVVMNEEMAKNTRLLVS